MGKNKDNEQMEALEALIDRGVIDEVIGVVKSGKEATVYCCRAANGTSRLLAAKVYRSHDVRRFGDDAVYQEGRIRTNRREDRAVKNKSRTGVKFAFGSWVAAEYATLSLLHRAGADVPEPVAQSDSVIIMEYVGDESGPAPPLSSVRLDPEEAQRLFARLMCNIELALACDRVHGDLSAFNVLYLDGDLRIIDFPQAVDPRFNHSAAALLERDIDRLCRYFARFGVGEAPDVLARRLWSRFLRSEL